MNANTEGIGFTLQNITVKILKSSQNDEFTIKVHGQRHYYLTKSGNHFYSTGPVNTIPAEKEGVSLKKSSIYTIEWTYYKSNEKIDWSKLPTSGLYKGEIQIDLSKCISTQPRFEGRYIQEMFQRGFKLIRKDNKKIIGNMNFEFIITNERDENFIFLSDLNQRLLAYLDVGKQDFMANYLKMLKGVTTNDAELKPAKEAGQQGLGMNDAQIEVFKKSKGYTDLKTLIETEPYKNSLLNLSDDNRFTLDNALDQFEKDFEDILYIKPPADASQRSDEL